uniref:Uncharacterized protein MANES_16G125300 n=1 Tax=Rhizophora mucronata TaxID=61149 RepID=A0A2P2NYA5_RHIMU
MATRSRTRRSNGPVLRSLSPCGRLIISHTSCYSSSSSSSSSSAFASSTSSSFASGPSTFFYNNSHHRSASPTRVNLNPANSLATSSCRFSIDRSISPNRSISLAKQNSPISLPKKTCMCSPTTHPGSFRCSLHRNVHHSQGHSSGSNSPMRLNMMRSAMKNSLVRIGGVEGEWVKRALTALIRPSSHQLRRRADFQPRPSRLSIMSKADSS